MLPFSHSFPPLRFLFSLSLRHRTSQEKESKGEGPESQVSHQQQDGYQRHACTRSAHRFSCLCKSHLILKPKILHIVALLAIHDLTIHTFWSRLQMHGSHFDSAYELYELICCCMKNVCFLSTLVSCTIWVGSLYHGLYCLYLGFRALSCLIVTIMFWYDVTIVGDWSG